MTTTAAAGLEAGGGKLGLHFHGGAHGFGGRCEFGQKSVAGVFDDAAAMGRNSGIDKFFTGGPPGVQGRRLVFRHKACITRDIRGKHGRKTPLDRVIAHRFVAIKFMGP